MVLRLPAPHQGMGLQNHWTFGSPLNHIQGISWRSLLPSQVVADVAALEWLLVTQLSQRRQVALWLGLIHLPIAFLSDICPASVFCVVFILFWGCSAFLGKPLAHSQRIAEGVNAKHLSLSSQYVCWLFTGLKPWMILQTQSAVTCNSSYPVLLWMWCEFHVRKYKKTQSNCSVLVSILI